MSHEEIKALEDEITTLEERLCQKKALLRQIKEKNESENPPCPYFDQLSSDEIVRYSRQMIMPQITKAGQIALKNSKILIVGAGGLGCPASLYLAAAGVGEIHVMDYDQVELSNLHRQILHYEGDVGLCKAQSVTNKLLNINSSIKVVSLHIHASSTIIEYVKKHKYDTILDCSDNAPTRYLLNDICVFNNIPLVSGSALQMEGQLTVYNYKNGPCYRCLFPIPPPAHTVTNCGDGGVLGPVAGVIGVLQALEAIKILTKSDGVLFGRMLLFDGTDAVFRTAKLRHRVSTCDICGNNPKITKLIDYEHFCGSRAHDKVVDIDVLQTMHNVDVGKLKDIIEDNVVIDVRPKLEFDMCKLPKTINLPFSVLTSNKGVNYLEEIIKNSTNEKKVVYLLCRRGNDSQRSVEYLKQNFTDSDVNFINIKGGLHAYSKSVDPLFPVY